LFLYKALLWIRIGLNADPDPAFYLSADVVSQTNAGPDPDPGQTSKSQKVEFLHANMLKVDNMILLSSRKNVRKTFIPTVL
jgi:hypothetical protein